MTRNQPGTRGHLSLVPALPKADSRERLRPRRPVPATYTLRIALEDVEPEIWRWFTVPSDTMLDALHPTLQTVMGWKDRHPHSFTSASERHADDALRFDMRPGPDDDDFGEFTLLEFDDTVRLDELLADVGDRLFYEYDFGDGWSHTITLVQVNEPQIYAGPVCLDGARRCPPEGVGGAFGYARLLAALADPLHVDHRSRRAPAGKKADPERFSAKKVNRKLRRRDAMRAARPQPGTFAAALLELIPEKEAPQLYSQLERAQIQSAPDVSAADAALATASLRWLLGQVGDEGAALTAAGHLPAAVVKLARAELGWERPTPTAGNREAVNRQVGNREADCPELRDLRKAAAALGLVETADGRLRATRLGAALKADPAALFAHVAERLPLRATDVGFDATAIWLVLLAAGGPPSGHGEAVAEAMAVMQWCTVGPPVRPRDLDRLVRPTASVLRGLGAIRAEPSTQGDAQGPTPGPEWGRELVRASLTRVLPSSQ